MFNWTSLFIMIGIIVALLIPAALFIWLVRYLRDTYFINKRREAAAKRSDIESLLSGDLSFEKRNDILSKNPEYIKADKEETRCIKILNFLDKYFSEECNNHSWFYSIIIEGIGYLGIVCAICLTACTIAEIPIEISRVNHWENTYTTYMTMEHPTFKNCQKAEETNENLDDSTFIKPEVRNKLERIDTELLWSRFYSNIEVYAPTLEGSLLRLAEAENKLANTLDKFKK